MQHIRAVMLLDGVAALEAAQDAKRMRHTTGLAVGKQCVATWRPAKAADARPSCPPLVLKISIKSDTYGNWPMTTAKHGRKRTAPAARFSGAAAQAEF
jgi:hypothetical protein